MIFHSYEGVAAPIPCNLRRHIKGGRQETPEEIFEARVRDGREGDLAARFAKPDGIGRIQLFISLNLIAKNRWKNISP